MNDSYVTDYTSPAPGAGAPVAPQPADESRSQLLEDQNIFSLLGVTDGTEEEKSRFLDDLQQVIWEDFLENDVALLILDSEHQKLKDIIGGSSANLSIETQEKIIEYLEELIPDLEEIMVDKAVRLKADLFRERVESLKTLYVNDPQKLEMCMQAESYIHEGSWALAADTLNSL
ncbi:MAG: hypothetical protein H6773_04170 [Pseudomonadales bacterium]|nr:hypothetical protein [Pseudomonadales bacterium]